MQKRIFFPAVLCILSLNIGSIQAQQLTIQTDSDNKVTMGRAEIEALPITKVVIGNSGETQTFEGVVLRIILDKAGVQLADSLKGKRLASCLLVGAADDYHVIFALPELDSAFTDKQIILAFLKNGKPLDEKEGPYRIVIPDEKRMARWVKQVTTLKIVNVQ
jgi:hypothetical protein